MDADAAVSDTTAGTVNGDDDVDDALGLGAGEVDGGRIGNDDDDDAPAVSVIFFGDTGANCDEGDLLSRAVKLALPALLLLPLLLLLVDGWENVVGDGNGDEIVAFVGVAGFERENCLSRISRTIAVFNDCD